MFKVKTAELYLRRSRKDVANSPQGQREKTPHSGLNSSSPFPKDLSIRTQKYELLWKKGAFADVIKLRI